MKATVERLFFRIIGLSRKRLDHREIQAMNVNWEIATLNQQVQDLQQSIADVQRLFPSDESLQPQIDLWNQTLAAGKKALARLKAQHPCATHTIDDYAAGAELECIHLLPPKADLRKPATLLDPELADLQAKLDQL